MFSALVCRVAGLKSESNSNLTSHFIGVIFTHVMIYHIAGVYRRPKPSAEAEGFNPLASASAAEVLWPKVWPKVNV